MTDGQLLEDVNASNESSFQELIWTLGMSAGQFVLILARCNYEKERSRWVQRLKDERSVAIREIRLEKSVKTLYTTIVAALPEEPQPSAVMVLGLESVSELELVLTSTNQVREEFRKNFAFPLVLWVNDHILRQMIRLVPDFKSWSTTFTFTLATNELIDLLQQNVDAVLSVVLDVGDGQFLPNATILDEHYRLELESAISDLQSRGEELQPELKAGVQFLLGRDAYASGQIEEALSYYQTSLAISRQQESQEDYSIQNPHFQAEPGNETKIQNQIGVLLFHIGLCHLHKSELQKSETPLQEARDNFQQCVEVFEQGQRLDLAAKFIGQLGEVLQRLKNWVELQTLAQKSLNLHQTYGTSVRLAQDYGFLAAVALNQSKWSEASQAAQQALEILDNTETSRSHQGLYLLLLAQAQQHSNQLPSAVNNLETARQKCAPQDDPQLYIQILAQLRSLYFQQGEYLKAFGIKQKQRSIEQQFGFRAFIGAGSLKSQQRAKSTVDAVQHQETVAQEISASGRQQDVEHLIERMTRDDCKLTVIHGQSGVGKSSIVNAGLVPALKQRTIATRDVLPVPLRVYTNWVTDLGELLGKPDSTPSEQEEEKIPNLIKQLHHNADCNLLTVLIFDQFEEFFFVYIEPAKRKPFFEFLSTCLNTPFVKVILSLREDYLHYLLECNRLEKLDVINNDILNKNILYYLGNFSRTDAKLIIQRLTDRAQFYLEPALVEQLVNDLAGELDEVRPIELQIVGTQLQEQKIFNLEQYKNLGKNPKEQLVQSYLNEVVEDCGAENKQSADLVLYLLTDEKNKRPLKTRNDLEKNLKHLGESLSPEADRLNLVLDIFVNSGLVLLAPENPAKRYQLVHDYLVELIRSQQKAKADELFAREKHRRMQAEEKLEELLAGEKQRRKQVEEELEQSGEKLKHANQTIQKANRRFQIGSAILVLSLVVAILVTVGWHKTKKQSQETAAKLQDADFKIKGIDLEQEGVIIYKKIEFEAPEVTFLDAMIAGQELNEMVKSKNIKNLDEYPALSPMLALQQTLDGVRKQYQIFRHPGEVSSVSFNPSGQVVATASIDGKVRLWDVHVNIPNSLKPLELKHNKEVWSISFSPKGDLLATISGNNVQLWKRQDNKISSFKKIKSNEGQLWSISFSPDGKLLATTSENGTAQLWNLQGSQEARFKVAQGKIKSISFSSKGQLATGATDGTVSLWNQKGILEDKFPAYKQPVKSVSFAPNGQLLATGLEDGTVSLLDLQGHPKATWKGHQREVSSIRFSSNGQQLATTSFDGTARLWDLKGIQLAIFKGDEPPVKSSSFSPNGQLLATASVDGTARLWDLKPKDNQIIMKADTKVMSVSFRKQDGLLATGLANGKVQFRDWQGKTWGFKAHDKSVFSVSFSPDGQHIATASEDGTARLWDLQGSKRATFEAHTETVRSVSFSPVDKLLATASEDGTVGLWNLDGKLKKLLKPDGQQVFSVSFSPDGKYLASGSADGVARLWDLKGQESKKFKGNGGPVFSVSFSPDGKYLATASENGIAQLWDLQGEGDQQKEKTVFEGHSNAIRSVSFSPDGQQLATTSRDQTVRVWNLNGKPLAIFEGHSNWIDSVSFSPDGKWLATASQDKTARLWRVKSLSELLNDGCNQLQSKSLNTYFPDNPENLKDYQGIMKVCKNKR